MLFLPRERLDSRSAGVGNSTSQSQLEVGCSVVEWLIGRNDLQLTASLHRHHNWQQGIDRRCIRLERETGGSSSTAKSRDVDRNCQVEHVLMMFSQIEEMLKGKIVQEVSETVLFLG